MYREKPVAPAFFFLSCIKKKLTGIAGRMCGWLLSCWDVSVLPEPRKDC